MRQQRCLPADGHKPAWDHDRNTYAIKRGRDMVSVASAMMVRIGFLSVCGHLVRIVRAMIPRKRLGDVDAADGFYRMCKRPHPHR